jgi:serine/threonine protein phosphatase 1
METYVIGDIHGADRALAQVLERSPFRPGLDRLIQLGDVADGWPDTPACVERLLGIPNSIWLTGNHDWWTAVWLATGQASPSWLPQGGQATYDAYQPLPPEQRQRHFDDFFGQQQTYHEDERGNLYVHAGYDPGVPIEEQDPFELFWTRDLWRQHQPAAGYHECFIGHTPTWPASPGPEQRRNVWNLDQGAGFGGRLTMLNVRTKQYVQSDPVPELYPGVQGRG